MNAKWLTVAIVLACATGAHAQRYFPVPDDRPPLVYRPPPIYAPPMPLPSIEQVFGFVMSLPGVQKQLYRLTVPPSHSQPQPYAPPPPMPAAPAPQQDASIPPRDGELSQQEWKQKLLDEGRAYCNRYPGDPVCGREKLGRSPDWREPP